jgi:hypothetical protein
LVEKTTSQPGHNRGTAHLSVSISLSLSPFFTMADVQKEATATAVAIASPKANSGTPMWQQEKQGAKCCGCCCDFRRATIVVSMVFIVLGVIIVIGTLAATATFVVLNANDDEVLSLLEDGQKQSAILTGVGIVTWICALVGAMKYNVPLIAINVCYMVVSFIVQIILTNKVFDDANEVYKAADELRPPISQYAISAVFLVLFIYPQVGTFLSFSTLICFGINTHSNASSSISNKNRTHCANQQRNHVRRDLPS